MHVKSLFLGVFTAFAILLAPFSYGAAWIGAEQNRTGISDLLVDGISYDVTFVDGTCASVYNPGGECMGGVFDTLDSSEAAAQALFEFLKSDQAVAEDLNPQHVHGCATDACIMAIRYNGSFAGVMTVTNATPFLEGITGFNDGLWGSFFAFDIDQDTSGVAYVYAKFAPSAVPLPAAAYLFLTALAGLPMMRRLKRS